MSVMGTWTVTGDVNRIYPALVQEVLNHGQVVSPRNKPTKEIRPVMLQIDPTQAFLTAHHRTINLPFALAECLWILAGRDDVEMVKHYNSQIGQFSDNGISFWAAYGRRLRHANPQDDSEYNSIGHDQIEEIIHKLREDNNTRQAVMTIWNPSFDNKPGHKDYACNVVSMIKIRDGKLQWHQVIRSNDIIWGMPYNFIQWSTIMNYIASRLEVPSGTLTYTADSLHLYTSDYGAAKGDDPASITEFDLYKYMKPDTMNLTYYGEISDIMKWEEAIRNSNTNLASMADAPNNFGSFWMNCINIWDAYSAFKRHEDNVAYVRAKYANPFFRWMLLKNFYQWRWKDSVYYTGILRRDLPTEIFNWITEENI